MKIFINVTLIILLTASSFAEDFDFLSKAHPTLVDASNEEFKVTDQEKQTDLLESVGEHGILQSAKYTLGLKVNEPEIVTASGLPGVDIYNQFQKQQLNFLSDNHNHDNFFKVFFDRKLKSPICLEDIVLAAEYIYQLVHDEGGGTVLFLGRTPCLLQVAYEELMKQCPDETQRAVHLNYSSHADAESFRINSFTADYANLVRTRNIVSPEKLAHYFAYMDSKNLSTSGKIYIVDIIGSGSGLNSFLHILNGYYEHKDVEMPDLRFLYLSECTKMSILSAHDNVWNLENIDGNLATLVFPDKPDHNMKPYTLLTSIVHMHVTTIAQILDNDFLQYYLVHGIQYPAQKWRAEYDAERDNGAIYHAKLYKWLKINMKKYIQFHMKKLG
jgi:hypothetical protein